MSIQDIANTLRNSARDGLLNLDASLVNLPSLAILLSLLEQDALSLEMDEAGVSVEGERARVSGRATLLGAPASVSLLLEQDAEGKTECTLNANVSALTLAALTHHNLVPTTRFDPGAFPSVAFDNVALTADSKNRTLSVAVEDSNHEWKILDESNLSLRNIGFAMSRSLPSQDGQDKEQSKVSLTIGGTLSLGGSAIKVLVAPPVSFLNLPDQWGLTLSARNSFAAGLSDISKLLTGSEEGVELPEGLRELASFRLERLDMRLDIGARKLNSALLTLSTTEPWEIAPSLAVEQVRISLMTMQTNGHRNTSTEIFSRMRLGERKRLGVRLVVPGGGGDWTLTLTEPLLLSGLSELAHLPGGLDTDALHFPGEVTNDNLWLNRFDLIVNPELKTINQIAVALSSDIQWNIISSLAVGKPSLSLEIANPLDGAQRAITGGMGGILTLGGVDIYIGASKADVSSGWQLTGALLPGETISLASLARDLLDGATFPSELPDQLTALEFSLQPKTKAYTLKAAFGEGWHIPSEKSDFAITEVSLSATRAEGGATEIEVWGLMDVAGVSVSVTAARAAGAWKLEGKTDDQQEINFTHLVTELFEKFGLALPANLPDFELKNLHLSYDFGKKEFAFSGDSRLPTKVVLGEVEHEVETSLDLKIGIDAETKERTFAGFLRGAITLGSAVFQGEYDFGDASVLKAVWDGAAGSLKFADLAASHGINHSLQVPGDMPLELNRASFEFDITRSQFTLHADSKFGEAFFIASDANGKWDFAFGILMNLSEIPGFPDAGALKLKNTMLILSTVRDDKFVVPSLPAAPPPQGQPRAAGRRTFPSLGTTPMRLKPGVTVAALLDFEDNGSDAALAQLSKVVGKTELVVQAAVSDSGASFLSYLNGSLTLFGSGNERLVLSDVYVRLDTGPAFGVFVAGSALIPFNHVTLEATGALRVSAEGMEAFLQVKAEADGHPTSLPAPFGLLGVSLDELDIEVGAVFEPPGVDLGIEGKFNIKGQQHNANDFIIVLELEGEVPNPIYLSTYIQSLSISDIITAYSGQVVSDIPDIIKQIKAEDVSVFWSETSGKALPDGRLAQAGFGFNGITTIGSLRAHAALTAGAALGVEGDAELPPIDWDFFKLTGNGKGVTVKQEQVNGEWQNIAKPPVTPEDAAKMVTRDFELIKPGGATALINSKHSPFIDVSATASLFNLVSDEVEIEVGIDGFTWRQKESIGSLFKTEFDCTLSKNGFAASAEFDLDIKGEVPIPILGVDLGSIDLDVGFHAALTVQIHDGSFTLTVEGSFHFDGLSLTMPRLTIDKDFKSFEELPGKILKQIQDEAETIFKDVFDPALKALEDAAKEAARIAEAAAQEAEKIAGDAEREAERVAASAKAAAETVAHETEVAEAEAAKLGKKTADALAPAVAEAQQITLAATEDAQELGRKAAEVLQDAAAEAAKIGEAVEKEAEQIRAVADKALSAAADEVKQIAAVAEQAAQEVLQAAVVAGKAIEEEASKALAAAEFEAVRIGNQIADKTREAAEWTKRQAEAAWDEVSKY